MTKLSHSGNYFVGEPISNLNFPQAGKQNNEEYLISCCVTVLSLLFLNQYLCSFTHQLPFHNLQKIPKRREHQCTSLFRRKTILYVIRARFQSPVLVCTDLSFPVNYSQCWKAQNKVAAYPVYRIWQGREDINVNFFWKTNIPNTIKTKKMLLGGNNSYNVLAFVIFF